MPALKARLSDAFDRFLDGVPDNRQVVFDDAGWRLKTDPAEHPDPAQSDSLVELHRWLDARSRSIRLADLLIEVENDLGFSVHFQRPGERVDPQEVCALLAAILAHGCNLGLYTMEKVAPAIAYRRLKYVSDWRASSRRTSARRSPASSMASPASTPPAIGATARRQPATGNASPCRTRCCSEPTAHASTTSRSRIERSLFTRAPGSHRRATEHLDAVDRRRAAEDDAGGYR